MNKALILKVVALCLVCSFLTGIVVYASVPTTTMTLSGGFYPESPDFSIFAEGSTYYAKNGYGTIEESGTGAEVMQYSIDELGDLTGGTIAILTSMTIAGPIDVTDKRNIDFVGSGLYNGTLLTLTTNEDMVFDMTGSRFISFRNLDFKLNSGYSPETVFYFARNSAGDSTGETIFYNCHFEDRGTVGTAFIYNFASEAMTFENCIFTCKGVMIDINGNNPESVDSYFSTQYSGTESTSVIDFRNCEFYCGTSTTEPIVIRYNAQNVLFDHCYFGGYGAGYSFLFDPYDGNINKVIIKHCHFEQLCAVAMETVAGREILGFTLKDNTVYLPSASHYTFVDFDYYNILTRGAWIKANYQSRGGGAVAEFHFRTIDESTFDTRESIYDMTLNTTNYIRYSGIVVESTNHVTCGGGYVYSNGTLSSYWGTGTTFP